VLRGEGERGDLIGERLKREQWVMAIKGEEHIAKLASELKKGVGQLLPLEKGKCNQKGFTEGGKREKESKEQAQENPADHPQ